ncbi:MAG: hypothetical protein F6K04_05910 [Leptolyngbya sp. SIO4C5]|nr:hypothetical protein [Leptolyngbya sp. SIO4C5]
MPPSTPAIASNPPAVQRQPETPPQPASESNAIFNTLSALAGSDPDWLPEAPAAAVSAPTPLTDLTDSSHRLGLPAAAAASEGQPPSPQTAIPEPPTDASRSSGAEVVQRSPALPNQSPTAPSASAPTAASSSSDSIDSRSTERLEPRSPVPSSPALKQTQPASVSEESTSVAEPLAGEAVSASRQVQRSPQPSPPASLPASRTAESAAQPTPSPAVSQNPQIAEKPVNQSENLQRQEDPASISAESQPPAVSDLPVSRQADISPEIAAPPISPPQSKQTAMPTNKPTTAAEAVSQSADSQPEILDQRSPQAVESPDELPALAAPTSQGDSLLQPPPDEPGNLPGAPSSPSASSSPSAPSSPQAAASPSPTADSPPETGLVGEQKASPPLQAKALESSSPGSSPTPMVPTVEEPSNAKPPPSDAGRTGSNPVQRSPATRPPDLSAVPPATSPPATAAAASNLPSTDLNSLFSSPPASPARPPNQPASLQSGSEDTLTAAAQNRELFRSARQSSPPAIGKAAADSTAQLQSQVSVPAEPVEAPAEETQSAFSKANPPESGESSLTQPPDIQAATEALPLDPIAPESGSATEATSISDISEASSAAIAPAPIPETPASESVSPAHLQTAPADAATDSSSATFAPAAAPNFSPLPNSQTVAPNTAVSSSSEATATANQSDSPSLDSALPANTAAATNLQRSASAPTLETDLDPVAESLSVPPESEDKPEPPQSVTLPSDMAAPSPPVTDSVENAAPATSPEIQRSPVSASPSSFDIVQPTTTERAAADRLTRSQPYSQTAARNVPASSHPAPPLPAENTGAKTNLQRSPTDSPTADLPTPADLATPEPESPQPANVEGLDPWPEADTAPSVSAADSSPAVKEAEANPAPPVSPERDKASVESVSSPIQTENLLQARLESESSPAVDEFNPPETADTSDLAHGNRAATNPPGPESASETVASAITPSLPTASSDAEPKTSSSPVPNLQAQRANTESTDAMQPVAEPAPAAATSETAGAAAEITTATNDLSQADASSEIPALPVTTAASQTSPPDSAADIPAPETWLQFPQVLQNLSSLNLSSVSALQVAPTPSIQRTAASQPPSVYKPLLSKPTTASDSSTLVLQPKSEKTLTSQPAATTAVPGDWSSISELLQMSRQTSAAEPTRAEPANSQQTYEDLRPFERDRVPPSVPTISQNSAAEDSVQPLQAFTEAPTAPSSPSAAAESSSATVASAANIEKLAQAVYYRLRQRIALERERRGGNYSGRF